MLAQAELARKVSSPGQLIWVAAVVAASLMVSACASSFFLGQHPSTTYRSSDSHMPEEVRSSIRTVALQPSEIPPNLVVRGDVYTAPGDEFGAGEGAAAGVIFTGRMISEADNPFPAIILAPIVLPIAVVVGAAMGAATSAVMEEIREARKDLTDALLEEDNRPLPSDTLVEELQAHLEAVKDVESTLIPAEAPPPFEVDAILEIKVWGLTITIEGGDAIMATEATAAIRRSGDTSLLYQRQYSVDQTESLNDWIADDNALWNDYVDRARRYFARRISEDFFEKIELRHVLRPVHSESFSGAPRRDYSSADVNTLTPTLTWELILFGGGDYGEWVEKIDETQAVYDLEIYDGDRLVYYAGDIQAVHHLVQEELERCTSYRWSVRPSYLIEGKTRVSDWMINNPIQNVWDPRSLNPPEASERFPLIKTPCN